MASTGGGGGTSTGSSSLQRQQSISSSEQEEIVPVIIDERKRKRMQSNRESARRSRMKKQQHLDDLVTQATNLRKENSEISTSINLTKQQYLKIEADNLVLKAQMDELRNRLESLNEIIGVMNGDRCGVFVACEDSVCVDTGFIMNNMNHWSYSSSMNLNQPIMASAAADIFEY